MELTAALTGHFAATMPFKPSIGTTITYDDRVDSVPATYHWPVREASGTSFAQRKPGFVQPGTGSGELEYVNGTLVDDDASGRCIGMGGGADTSVITIASHTNFDVTAGAWFCVVQPDSLAKMQIITRWPSTGIGAGCFYLEMQGSGALSAARRDGTGVANPANTITSPPVMTAGVPALVGVSWGSSGLRVWHGSSVVAAQGSPTQDWGGAPNVPIRVGRWVTGEDGFDGLIAHIVFLNFEPTAADIAKLDALGPGLSLLTGAHLGSVVDGSQVTFDIRDYGHFSETITSIDETTSETNISVTDSGETFTVTGINTVANESFGLSVTDARGTTPSANFTIDVTAGQSSGEYITTPEAHGWSSGNSNTANTAAFNTAVANASANAGSSSTGRGVVELVPGKTYVVRTDSGTITASNAAIRITSSQANVEIRTQGKPVVGGNQAKIQFESWNGKSACRQWIMYLQNTSNVKIGWLTLDGNKASCGTSFNDRTTWVSNNIGRTSNFLEGLRYDQAGNGAVSNLRVGGGNNITLKELDIKNALTDGLAVVGSGEPSGGTPATNFLAEDCYCHHNRRMDWGIPAGPVGSQSLTWDQIVFRRVVGRYCGDEPGVMVGQSPGASTDLEPLQVSQYARGVTLDHCEWRDCGGCSFDSSGNPPGLKPLAGARGLASDTHGNFEYFKMIDCISANNTSQAVNLNAREGAKYNHVVIENLVTTGNNQNIVRFGTTQTTGAERLLDFIFINCNVSSITMTSDWPDSGHDVTIWKGDFSPTVTTNGMTTVTVRNGFPP